MGKILKHWWKILGILLVFYTIIFGFLGEVPHLPILNETIRVLYFHVTMWFGMIILMSVALVYSVRYLLNEKAGDDMRAKEFVATGFFLATIGLLTGSFWARFTWGAWWVNDPKLNGTAVTLLIYLAYFVLRSSVDDSMKKARLAGVYNIFAYVMMIVFIGILPRMTDSLHPGNGGNPGFGAYDLDSGMRMVFYPAVLGWTLIALWITNLKIRYQKLRAKTDV